MSPVMCGMWWQVTELGTRARDAEAAAARAHDEVRGLREELGREQASLSALRARESELVRERDARGAEVDGVREELERVRVQLAAEAGGAREVQAALERVQMEAEGRGERLALKALAEQHALDAAVALQVWWLGVAVVSGSCCGCGCSFFGCCGSGWCCGGGWIVAGLLGQHFGVVRRGYIMGCGCCRPSRCSVS